MGRVILDTGVLVAAARGQLRLGDAVATDDEACLPALVIGEYLVGLALLEDPAQQAAQRAFLDEVLALVPVEDYTHEVAQHHAALLVHVRRSGEPRGAHDLIIAATARATGRTLITTDRRAGFDGLPDLLVRVIEQ